MKVRENVSQIEVLTIQKPGGESRWVSKEEKFSMAKPQSIGGKVRKGEAGERSRN